MISVVVTLLAAEPSVVVKGPAQTKTFDLKALGGLPQAEVEWREHGTPHRSSGVAVAQLLAAVGVDAGPKGKDVKPALKHAGLRAAVIARAPDGYVAVFSVAELWPGIGSTKAVLVWTTDGKPLENDGPLRLVVPTDQDGARAVHSVSELEVKPL